MQPHENLSLTDMEGEVWKPIAGYEQYYHVSNIGRVKSFKKKNPKILYGGIDSCGYRQVRLNDIRYGKLKYVHRLVADAFIFNDEFKKEINHKDGNKLNNNVSNLEWSTRSENIKHAYDNGMKNIKGEKNGQSKLTAQQVIEIRNKREMLNYQINDLAKEYGVDRSCISGILLRKSWKHI